MSSLMCLHRIHKRQMYVKFSVTTQDTEERKCMSTLVCLHRIQRRRMYVKFNVSTQDTEETNVCQV